MSGLSARQDTDKRLPWHILGAGAIGSLWATHLSRNGYPVTLLLRNEASMRAFTPNRELTLQTGSAQEHWPTGAEQIDAVPKDSAVTQVLVTTKSYDCLDALESLSGRLNDEAVIVLLQNGMGAQQAVAERSPRARVYAGSTTDGAYLKKRFHVVHAGHGKTWFGPLTESARRTGSQPLEALLSTQLTAKYDPLIEIRLWQKLAINAAINGLTAYYGCRNGALARQSDYRAKMKQLCEETEQLTRALGLELFQHPLIDEAIKVAEATATNYSSMLQDVRQGRKTEMSYINGYICTQAATLGIDVPTHRWLVEAIDQLEAK
jgi:2-dehydropantoate 2-reductase